MSSVQTRISLPQSVITEESMESTPKVLKKKRTHNRGLSSILFAEELRKMQRGEYESETVKSEFMG